MTKVAMGGDVGSVFFVWLNRSVSIRKIVPAPEERLCNRNSASTSDEGSHFKMCAELPLTIIEAHSSETLTEEEPGGSLCCY